MLFSKNKKKGRVRYKIKLVNKKKLPRLVVFRSNCHVYAQIIDDRQGRVLFNSSTLESIFSSSKRSRRNVVNSRKVGEILGKRAQEKNVKAVVFDRGEYIYHGCVKAVAEGARASGLKF